MNAEALSLAAVLQAAVIGVVAGVATLLSLLVCLWPRTDQPETRHSIPNRPEEKCNERRKT